MGKRSKQKKTKKIAEVQSQTVSKGISPYSYWVILILVLLFTEFIRLRLLSIPLERDEGEFAYMGQLILQGIPPYLISYNMKLPGIYAAYALVMFIFGQTTEGIHLGFLFINAATTILVFLLVKRLYESYTAIIASASFAILSISPSLLGTSAHASHFVLLPAVGGILLMLKAIDSNKMKHIFWSGILLGVSFLMKQPGLFFILFALLYFLFAQLRLPHVSVRLVVKHGSLFLLGALIPSILTCVILYRAGVFEKFWFWTFSYASEYVSEVPFSQVPRFFIFRLAEAIGRFYLLWGVAGIGIIALFWDKMARRQAPFVLGFSIFSFLAVCPGFYFRQHYFVFFLAAVGLLIGIAISSFKKLIWGLGHTFQYLSTILFLVICSVGVIHYGPFFFNLTPDQACSAMYSVNPFPQSVDIAKYIESHTQKRDEIAVLGSEPQICFYANRHSATGYIYTYPLMEDQKYALKMQKEMAEEIERARPKYLIFVHVASSWLVRRKSIAYIFDWYKEYTQKNFDLVGVIDVLSRAQTVYRWENEAIGYSPRSIHHLFVYKRKTSVD